MGASRDVINSGRILCFSSKPKGCGWLKKQAKKAGFSGSGQWL